MDSVQREVIEIVSRITRVPSARLKPETDLRTELNVDSLQGLQIVAALEKHFRVIVPDQELDSYSSIGLIADTVTRLWNLR